MIADFDLLDAPLRPGTTLLEASAGTGKTYTLAGIYLRLIIEHDLTPGEILVSTYTVAATAELRDRIRRLLVSALETCRGTGAAEGFLAELIARGRVERSVAQHRLEAALRSFDEAAIFTIHSFCQRTLQDRAFESGTLFDAELVADQQALLREVADDYWRTHFHDGEPALVALAVLDGINPAALARLLGNTV
ncbi:MAG TPA: UvrD-helicase domain-containing protein, partial [Chthoniobacteraceae bacterium]